MVLRQIMGFSLVGAAICGGLLVGIERPVRAQEKQAAPQKSWKDQREYNEANAAAKESDKAKKLALLDKWKKDYPASDYSDVREKMYADASSDTGAPPKQATPAK